MMPEPALKIYSGHNHDPVFTGCHWGCPKFPETAAKKIQEIKENLNGAEVTKEAVDHPKHYNSHPSGIECIEIVRHLNFNVGNAVKYLWRCGLKDQHTDIEDLKKAIWYLKDEITRLEGN